jgi:hypothetical protein
MVPKVHERLDSLDLEPCGIKEFCSETPKFSSLSTEEPPQDRVEPGSKGNHLNGYDALDHEPAGCSFEGPKKRSSNFVSNVDKIPKRFRGETIFGAFKCIKTRKQA